MSSQTSSKLNILTPTASGSGAELEEVIRAEIGREGVISFARFMELALYYPGLGYYERQTGQTGRKGDFYTNVSVGSLYGELLAFEFARRLQEIPGAVYLVEAGAHDGDLALDILGFLQQFHPKLFDRLTFRILEPSPRRLECQQAKLEPFGEKAEWRSGWDAGFLFQGICFSNELLDAMPVHRFRWVAAMGEWQEWGVTVEAGEFAWALIGAAKGLAAETLLPVVPAELAEVLPDGFCVEVSPGAVKWWTQAAAALQAGALMTADYGLTQDEVLRPERSQGSLRAFAHHTVSAEVLVAPGEKDITTHVNFDQIMRAGEAEGLRTEALLQQGSFLKGLLQRIEISTKGFPEWTPSRRRQLATLMHPEHLGRAFRMLVQARGS